MDCVPETTSTTGGAQQNLPSSESGPKVIRSKQMHLYLDGLYISAFLSMYMIKVGKFDIDTRYVIDD